MYAGLSDADISNEIIDDWLVEVVQNIHDEEDRQPWLEKTIDVPLIMQTIDNPFGSIESVHINGQMLTPTTRSSGEQFDSQGNFTQGTPNCWALSEGKVWFFPSPSEPMSVRMRGYVRPDSWFVDATSKPNVPDEFMPAIREWLLMQISLHESDTEQANNHSSLHDAAMQRAWSKIHRLKPTAHSLVLGGGQQPPQPSETQYVRWDS
jgi:hypothetical protein